MASKFKCPQEAHLYYFKHWKEVKRQKNAADLKDDAKSGSLSVWKKFLNATKKCHEYPKFYSRIEEFRINLLVVPKSTISCNF